MKKQNKSYQKKCSTCQKSGKCKHEKYFKDLEINTCPDYLK